MLGRLVGAEADAMLALLLEHLERAHHAAILQPEHHAPPQSCRHVRLLVQRGDFARACDVYERAMALCKWRDDWNGEEVQAVPAFGGCLSWSCGGWRRPF